MFRWFRFLLKFEFNYLYSSKQSGMWLSCCQPQHLSLYHCGDLCLPVRKGSGLGLNGHELNRNLGPKLLPASSSTFICWSCPFAGQFCVSNTNLCLAFSPPTDCPLANVSSSLSVCALLTLNIECPLTAQHGDVWALFTRGTQTSLSSHYICMVTLSS